MSELDLETSPFPIYVAYQTQVRQEILPELEEGIQPDRRLTDPAKIQASLEERKQDLRDKLALMRFGSSIKSLKVAAPVQGCLLKADSVEGKISPSLMFLTWLNSTFGQILDEWNYRRPGLCFVGFGIEEFLPIACVEALSQAADRGQNGLTVPLDLWYRPSSHMLVDPLKILFPSGLFSVLRPEQRWPMFLKLCAGGQDSSAQPLPGEDLDKDLQLLMSLTVRYQLLKMGRQMFAE